MNTPAINTLLRRLVVGALTVGAITAGAVGAAAAGHADTGAAPTQPHTVTHAPDADPGRNGLPGYSPSPHIHHRYAHQHAQ